MRTLALLAVLSASASAADSGFVAELSVGAGGTIHQTNSLQAHHAQLDVSIAAAIVRERDRGQQDASHVIGGVIGYRASSDFPLTGPDMTEEIYVGPLLQLFGRAPHEVRLGFGPDIITARRDIGGAYTTATAIGGWIEAQYLYRFPQRRGTGTSAFGAAVGVDGADVGYAGGRVPVGGWHLGALISTDF